MGHVVIPCNTQDELNITGREILVKKINELTSKQDYVTLGISGGRSVQGIFSLLKNETTLPWGKVHIFLVDERQVPLDHADSNYKLGKDLFIDHLIKAVVLPQANLHPFDMNKELAAYNKELTDHGGTLDIVLLGAGEDGHIGALFPNHASVRNLANGYIKLNDSPKPPADRVTISQSTLLKAKVAVLLFVSEAKQDAYNLFSADGPFETCPARLVKEIKNAYVLTWFR